MALALSRPKASSKDRGLRIVIHVVPVNQGPRYSTTHLQRSQRSVTDAYWIPFPSPSSPANIITSTAAPLPNRPASNLQPPHKRTPQPLHPPRHPHPPPRSLQARIPLPPNPLGTTADMPTFSCKSGLFRKLNSVTNDVDVRLASCPFVTPLALMMRACGVM